MLLCACPDASRSVSLSADTNKPSVSTYTAGESAEILFSISGMAAAQVSNLGISILDEFGNTASPSMTRQVVADDRGEAAVKVAMPTDRYGYYEVHAHLADGTTLPAVGTRPAGFLSYAVVPDPERRIDYGAQGSRFGLQGGFNASVNILSYLGVRYVLQDGAGWGELEPDFPGEYVQQREQARSKGLLLPAPNPAAHSPLYNGKPWQTYYLSMISRASLPAWAIRPGTNGKICKSFGALKPSAENALSEFASATAGAFRSDYGAQSKRYYQVTWEPAADWCFRGSATDLVRIYSLVYAAIHAADPGAVVAGPALFPEQHSTAQLRELWKAGLGRYIDAFAIHPYAKWPPESDHGLIPGLRLQLKEARQAAGRDIVLVGTEHGYSSVTIGNLDKALGDIRSTVIMLGEGAQFDFGFYAADYWDGPDPTKVQGFGYYWNLNPAIVWGTDKLGPKAVVPAYAAMSYFLDGSISDGPLTDLAAGQVGYRFHFPDGSGARVVWSPEGTSTYAVGLASLVCDWMGNCSAPSSKDAIAAIGQTPTYLLDRRL